MERGFSAALVEGEEFIGRLRYLNDVLTETRRSLPLTEEERESCRRAEREMEAALAEGRAALGRLAEAEAALSAARRAVRGAEEECRTSRRRAEAVTESVIASLQARPGVRPALQGALLDVLRGSGDVAEAPGPALPADVPSSPAAGGGVKRLSAADLAKAVFNTFFSITTVAEEANRAGGEGTPAAA